MLGTLLQKRRTFTTDELVASTPIGEQMLSDFTAEQDKVRRVIVDDNDRLQAEIDAELPDLQKAIEAEQKAVAKAEKAYRAAIVKRQAAIDSKQQFCRSRERQIEKNLRELRDGADPAIAEFLCELDRKRQRLSGLLSVSERNEYDAALDRQVGVRQSNKDELDAAREAINAIAVRAESLAVAPHSDAGEAIEKLRDELPELAKQVSGHKEIY